MPPLDETEKGVRPHLCEAPEGPFRQMGSDPFFPHLCDDHASMVPAEGEKGVRYILPESPSGCSAQNVPDPFFPADPQGISRRRWLELMGASLALAGAAGCRWEKRELRPFAKRPADRVPGEPQKFATTMDLAGSALGLLVTCIDGRPIKIEGNPNHPSSNGATNAFAQAAILELYDPDRSKNIIERTGDREEVRTWEEFSTFAREHFAKLRKTGGEGLRVLSEASSSPTLERMRGELLKQFPKAKWHDYEPIASPSWADEDADNFPRHLKIEDARTIVCLDADIFGSFPGAILNSRDFAAGRGPASRNITRLYVVESTYTLTGAAADHRWALPCKDIVAVAAALDVEIAGLFTGKPYESSKQAFIRMAAKDLYANRGHTLVVAGPRQPTEVHFYVNSLNASLENERNTTYYMTDVHEHTSPSDGIARLTSDIKKGRVETLLVLGGNPVYDAPVDLDFGTSLARVSVAIHLSLYRNETSLECAWHIPKAHFLESWGDVRDTHSRAFTILFSP